MFVTLEGLDGSGKTTQARLLGARLVTVVVTGGAGFIGSHVVEALLARGDEVHVVDDLSKGVRENVPAAATLHVHDVREPLDAIVPRDRCKGDRALCGAGRRARLGR